MMTKYEICTDTFEFRFGKAKSSIPDATADEIWSWYSEESCQMPTIVDSFDSLVSAKAEFYEHYANYGETHAVKGSVWWSLRGQVAWIEETIYYDDGDFESDGGTLAVSAEPYKREGE